MRLDGLQGFDDYILDAMHDCLEVDAALFKVVLQLGQVPLRGVLSILVRLGLLAAVTPRILDVVLVLLVDRVVGQVNESLIDVLLAIGVLLCCEASQSLLKEVHLERIKTGDECIYAQIILEAIDQVRVANILRHNISWLALHFLFLADYFDATAT